MDHLPDLGLLEIISNFNLNEQFKLRSINKRWKSLIELSAKNKKSLFVYDIVYSNQERWPSDYEKVDSKEIINLSFFKYFCLENNYFPNITKLFLYNLNSEKFETDELKSRLKEIITNLKELSVEIINSYIESFGQDLIFKIIDIENLILPNLKVFSIKELYIEQENIKVNAPNLEKFTIHFLLGAERKIILSNPQSVKVLDCQNSTIINDLNNCHNLEYLICDNLDSNFNLSNYSKLKKLELYPEIGIQDEFFFEDLFRQKRNSNLEIFIYGFKFERADGDLQKILGILFRERVNYYFMNLNLLTDKEYDLNFDIKYFKRNFIFDYEESLVDNLYFSKVNIQKLSARDLKSFKNLAKFLNEIGGIKELRIVGCILDDRNIEYLKSVPFIYHLNIEGCKIYKSLDFFGEIKYLNFVEFCACTSELIETAIEFVLSIKKFNIDRYLFVSRGLHFFNSHNGIKRNIISKITGYKNTLKNTDELIEEINIMKSFHPSKFSSN